MAELPASESDDDLAPIPEGARPNPKLQRWVDFIVSLLVRQRPATFLELARDVPEYWHKLQQIQAESDEKQRDRLEDSLKRAFERDKDELRAFGVPIESVGDEGNESGAYRLRRRDFYLPYLCMSVPDAQTAPRKRDRGGHDALASLAFEPDELQAVVDAGACVRSLGDPLLTHEAESALRKLAVDLPVDAVALSADEPRVLLPRAQPDATAFERLSDALMRRKSVRFDYHAMTTDRIEAREVEPYGLFFLHGHWYLAAWDRARVALRNFRLNRVSNAKVNDRAAQSADYEIPSAFRLRDHAQSRHAWELGDGDATQAIVSFTGDSAPTRAACTLGSAIEGSENRRAFQVRRMEPFVRWLLSFAGEARPESPPAFVQAYADEVKRISPAYERCEPVTGALGSAGSDGRDAPAGERPRRAWQPKGAAAQLRRILQVVPRIADGKDHDLREVAEAVGADFDTVRRDLYSLVARYDAPGGFVEGVQLYMEPDRVSFQTGQFDRPMRLSVPELCALELGLSVLRAQRPPDEHAVLERAGARLRSVIAKLPADPIPDGLYGASLGEHGSMELLVTVRTALRDHRKLRLVYRKSGSTEAGARVVHPYALISSSGMLYVIAHCEMKERISVFRMDRVEEAEATAERFEPLASVSLDALLAHGKPFIHPNPETLRVRYSPRVARWIAEREGRQLDADGGLEMEHPLADHEWAMRHVLQYGVEAEVLAPAGLREKLRTRLGAMLASARAESCA